MDNTSDQNREEAFKAKKTIALENMENNDFRRAQQIILEAQELYPELAENMSQMLIICKVHCAAESVVGGAKDLYGILDVEETADESMITKQYRRLAFSTHPDKCCFAGAPDAFKLVAEAYSVLSDPAKRTEHEYKRKYRPENVQKDANKQPSKNTGVNEGEVSGSSPTFWTNCPHCEYQFQYFKTALNRSVKCQTCSKIFTAYSLEDQQSPIREHDWKRKNNGRKQASTMPGSESYSPSSSDSKRQHVDGKHSQNDSDGRKREKEHDYSCNIGMNCNQILDGDIANADRQSSQNEVSSNINVQEKTSSMSTSDDEDHFMEETIDSVLDKCNSHAAIKIRDINSITYNGGGVDQIWALYDNIDHMPRSYAAIKYVRDLKCLYLLKFYPLSEEEKEWNNQILPVACGKFCLGEKVDILEYSSLFSHTVECKEFCVNKVSGRRGSAKTKMMVYEIYPKRAEVWALYKGWSKQWNSSDADNNRSYGYEIVEVLSDMSDIGGTNVIPLIRIEGFPSLLVAAKDKSSFHIPSSEVFRFSHKIPHYRVSGNENILKKINGPTLEKNQIVPEGFLILDSSCLPSELDATLPSMNLDTYMSQSKKRSRHECQYEFFPQVGEIWAIFMDWTPERSPSSTDCCELAVGEIIECNDASTKFLFLAKVDGSTAIFKPDKQKGVLEIPTGENLRFSQHIPATFRVMKEKRGKRRVFYDLDPAYLVTAQDHATSSGNRNTVENLAQKQKTAVAQVGPRRTARPTRPNSHYKGPQWQ